MPMLLKALSVEYAESCVAAYDILKKAGIVQAETIAEALVLNAAQNLYRDYGYVAADEPEGESK